MAQSKVKKKAAAKPKRPAAKAITRKSAPKPTAKKKAVAQRPKSVTKAKKAAAKAKPVRASAAKAPKKPATLARKPAPKKAAARKVAPGKRSAPKPKPAQQKAVRRPVAVSHRPQAAAVSVQARPARTAPATESIKRKSQAVEVLESGAVLTEEQIRKAPESAYMNESQLAFFQERLLNMRNEVLARELDVKERLHQREVFADPADRASAEEEHWLDLRLRERESLLLKKIDDALRRIRDRDYGYCEKTGESIGIARLLARPTATVCVDIKGQDERAESQFRDR